MKKSNPRYHVPEIEQNNITVKERYRTQYHRLPIQNIPKFMVRYLAYQVVIKLIFFPVKGGSSTYYSPQTIVNQNPLDYNRYFRITLGAFVQANIDNNPKNQMFRENVQH